MSQPEHDSISPGITSTVAVLAVDANDSTLDETRHSLPTFTMWILTLIEVFGPIILRPDKNYKWLSAINYHGLNVRLEDTGLWVIDGVRFARWKATADNFVWICGTRMYSHHLLLIIFGSKLLSKMWLVTTRPIWRVLLHTSFSTERMAKKVRKPSEVSFDHSRDDSRPLMVANPPY